VACVAILAACGKSEPGLAEGNGHDDGGAGSTGGDAGAIRGGAGSTTGGAGSSSAGGAGSIEAGTSGSPVNAAGAPVSVGGSEAMGGASSALGGELNEPAHAGAPSAAGAPNCSGYYQACGCGCCGGGSASPGTCVYSDLGQDLSAIVAEDVARKQDTQGCASAGCSLGRDYFCCAAPPAVNDGATYQTSRYIGGVDRIRLHKMATACTTFELQQTFPANPVDPNEFPVEVPARWKLESVTSLPCTSSAIGARAIGAIGKFSLRVLEERCVVDAHLSAFFTNDERELNTVRFDVDAVPIDLPVSQCQ
jgi:hypothetical protein